MMMLNASELLVVAAIIFVVVGLQKLPQISEAAARLRLSFQKGLADDVIDVSSTGGELDHDDVSGGSKPGASTREP